MQDAASDHTSKYRLPTRSSNMGVTSRAQRALILSSSAIITIIISEANEVEE